MGARRIVSITGVVLAIGFGHGVRAEAPAVYVAPDGSDAWTGALAVANPQRTDGPVATPQRARDLARVLKSRPKNKGKSVHVVLRAGTYYLKEALALTPEDSGTADAPVVWSAYEAEQPVLSGGQRVTGWTKSLRGGKDVWAAALPVTDDGDPVHELWLDDKRLQRCRWPKRGTLTVAGLGDDEDHSQWQRGVNQFRYQGDDVGAWPDAAAGEAIVTCRWVESHLPIAGIDAATKVIRFGKRSVFRVEAGDRYWIENVPACLTEPGEFQVNVSEKRLYLIPPAGVDPNRSEVVAPRLAEVLRLDGRPAAGRFVEHVRFRGIEFAHAEWSFDRPTFSQQRTAGPGDRGKRFRPDPDRSGFSQADIGVPGAIWCVGTRSCDFDDCRIAHTGTYGMELSQGCQNTRVRRCTLTDLGAGGIKIGEVSVREPPEQRTSGNEVADCTITDGGNLYPSAVGVWIGQSSDNTIAHNDIHGFWYTGISVGWTWGYGKTASGRNTVEHNHVHHIGKKTDANDPILSDMAGIYTLGDQEGTVIRFNSFHDIAGLKYGGWGIYFDEGTTHILAENNLVYRTTHGGFHQHYGKENTVRNNIFAFGRDAQIQRSRIEDHLSFTFERNVVLWDSGKLLAGDWKKLNVAFDRNTYWRADGGEIRFGPMTWTQWRAAGMDKQGTITDPHFADPHRGDFRLTNLSAPAPAGFEAFDLGGVGPRPVR